MKRLFALGLCLVVLPFPSRAQQPAGAKESVDYVLSLRNKDGGFRPSAAAKEPSLRATSSALRALKYCGGKLGDPAATQEFVKKCHDKETGGFADTPGGKPDVVLTAVGAMAVVELKMPTEPYEAGVLKYLGENAKTFDEVRMAAAGCETLGKKPEQAAAWMKTLDGMKTDGGTFGKGDAAARETGSVAAAVLRLGGKLDSDAVLKVLKEGQRKDGGFGKGDAKGSDLETSYRVMRTFHMLKAKPDAAKLKEFVASCRNKDGGYGPTPGQDSTLGATYFASIILHWLG